MEEKNIRDTLAQFEMVQAEKIEETGRDLKKAEYYEKFDINDIDFKDIIITTEEDENGNISRSIYCKSKEEWLQILTVDSEGNVEITNPELEKIWGMVNLEKIEQKNKQNLKGISKKAEPEELKEEVQKEDDQKQEEQKTNEGSENLNISYYREIKDPNFEEQVKQDFAGYEEVGLAYSETDKAFAIVGKTNSGDIEKVDGIQQGRSTFKSVISIDEEGKEIQKKVPHVLMKTNHPDTEISVSIGPLGYIETGAIKITPSNIRVERQIREDGETEIFGPSGRENREFTRTMREEGNYATYNWTDKNEDKIRNMDKGDKEYSNVKDEVSGNEDTLIRDAAENRAKVSEEEFRKILETMPEDMPLEEKIDATVDKIEEQYRGTNS